MPTVEITGMERDILDEYMTLLISVDENDQIVQIILEEPLLLTEGKLTGSISFVGENRGIDDIIVNMQMSAVKDLSQLDEGFFRNLAVRIRNESWKWSCVQRAFIMKMTQVLQQILIN